MATGVALGKIALEELSTIFHPDARRILVPTERALRKRLPLVFRRRIPQLLNDALEPAQPLAARLADKTFSMAKGWGRMASSFPI